MSSPSSLCNAVDGDPSHLMSPSEALLQPVRDMGHSEILRGHFRGTQPFEKGLGFPHRVPELRAWDDVHLKGQVRCTCMCGQTIYPTMGEISILQHANHPSIHFVYPLDPQAQGCEVLLQLVVQNSRRPRPIK